DTGGGVKDFLHHITNLGLQYSVGFYGMPPIVEALSRVPRQAWLWFPRDRGGFLKPLPALAWFA
ncbi:hypothetical protein KL864_35975, partial [Mycolicibacterium goodii]|nr:hypothetical protein [Mycolicibacterium goodii]